MDRSPYNETVMLCHAARLGKPVVVAGLSCSMHEPRIARVARRFTVSLEMPGSPLCRDTAYRPQPSSFRVLTPLARGP